ncbi:MAG TPA: hypothetical protein VM008_22555 [Phycisphaerae bacterium]|nr:hypothetical protein [Phycisphaerae bacterium]
MLLTQLSPIAAKIYLALHLLGQDTDPPTAQVHRSTLAEFTNLSIRSCTYALRQLQDLGLITHLPKQRHAPAAFRIHPLPYTQPAAHVPASNAQPLARPTPSNTQPAARLTPVNAQPVAPINPKNPITASKAPNGQPAATNTTLSLTPREEALLANPAILKLLMSTFSPAENAALLSLVSARSAPEDHA